MISQDVNYIVKYCYNNSLKKALLNIYPDISFDERRFLAPGINAVIFVVLLSYYSYFKAY